MEKAACRWFSASRITSLFSIVGLSLALAACGGGGDGGAAGDPLPADPPPVGPVEPPGFSLPDFPEADVVFGQLDFVSDDPNQDGGAPDNASLFDPAGLAVSETGMLFIADAANRRVIAISQVPQRLFEDATFALGQPDMFSNGDTGEPDRYVAPRGISIGAGKLAVADPGAHRVLIYDSIPTDKDARPVTVIGQPDFDSHDQTCDGVHLSSPTGVHITPDGKLIVADSGHSRVLIWGTIPAAGQHGVQASVVLGQPDPESCEQNAGTGGPGQETMNRPEGVWSDGTRLAVADSQNHRVLLWSEFNLQTPQPPDRVVGQANFDSASFGAATAESLSFPRAVASNGSQLAVSDTGNSRVLLWNRWPAVNGQVADAVVGQRDFLHGTRNDDDGNRVEDGAPTARTLDSPFGITFHQNKLLVVDEGDNRLLIFQSQ